MLLTAPNLNDPALSPDGTTVVLNTASVDGKGTSGLQLVRVAKPGTSTPTGRRLPPASATTARIDSAPVWSPDGIRVAYLVTETEPPEVATTTDQTSVRVLTVGSDQAETELYAVENTATSVAGVGLSGLDWSADGSTILTTKGETTETSSYAAVEIDVGTGKATERTGAPHGHGGLVYSSQSRTIVTSAPELGGDQSILNSWTADTSAPTAPLKPMAATPLVGPVDARSFGLKVAECAEAA